MQRVCTGMLKSTILPVDTWKGRGIQGFYVSLPDPFKTKHVDKKKGFESDDFVLNGNYLIWNSVPTKNMQFLGCVLLVTQNV